MAGLDLAKEVTVTQPYDWEQTEWQLGTGYGHLEHGRSTTWWPSTTAKKNILRMLAERGCKVTVVPAKTPPPR